MSNEFDFTTTDSADIYASVIENLMLMCDEPLYPGDERRLFGEALAAVFVALYSEFNDNMKQRTLRYARGVVLDAIGDRYAVRRASPSSASATFRFEASAIRSENIIIPKGTKITTDGSLYFETDETVVLQSGTTSVDVTAICSVGGAVHNGYSVGTITTLVDLIPYIGAVYNTTTSSGGDDGEPYDDDGDNRYRERIRLAPSMQSTAGPESAYRFFAMSADPDIIDVSIVSPSPNVINIYPLMTGGEIPDVDMLDAVLAAFPDDVRPMTDQLSVIAPAAVEYDIQIKYYCTVENEADTQQLQLPVTIPLMLAFFIAFYAFKAPDSPIVFWGSMIPFTSPIVMLARIPYDVPTWELLMSIGILVVTFIACGWASAKIYKIGILMFGKKTSFKDLWKWLKQK